jgi:hypothetical protein
VTQGRTSHHRFDHAGIWGILRTHLQLTVPADKGCVGGGGDLMAPNEGRDKPPSQKAGERASTQLKTWCTVRKHRCCP